MNAFPIDSVAPDQTGAVDRSDAEALIRTEARFLDEKKWQDWLDLYTEDAWFWMPSWKSPNELVDDPTREISFIYYDKRERLEERIWRINSGRSPASTPLRRTVHLVHDVRLTVEAGTIGPAARCNFVVHVYDVRQKAANVLFGRYDYILRHCATAWKIAGKKVTLLNDHMSTTLDIYCV